MDMRDLERRTGTALVYGVVVLAALFAPWPTFAILVAILAALGYLELGAASPSELMLLSLALVAAFGAVAIAVFLEQALRGRPLPAVLGAVFTLGGALYLGYFFGYLIELWLANDAGTRGWLGTLPVWLLLALVPTWSADVAAYVVGARIGRRKIAPRISPGKTWEGTLAGFGAAAVVVLLIATSAGIKTGPTLLLTLLVGPVGFASDLLESAIKRAAGAKDSGTMLPGHGGVLDRIDSLILVAPAVAFVLWLARGAFS
ncbi:MAG: phosphatidate cytidylyltransferase [Chloroflexi bacterium]|nr:MAG: phosphatidate cytidylyltransferase [Chloroflexota bacterium]